MQNRQRPTRQIPDRPARPDGAAPGRHRRAADGAELFPLDADGLSLVRTPLQVLQIVYMSTPQDPLQPGGFFPNGINGTL